MDPILAQNSNVHCYRRYIDDIFLIWTGSEASLQDFLLAANQLIQGIKLTSTYSTTQCDYLDLAIDISSYSGVIGFSTHQKALNKYLYISPRSCHPPHVLSGFIKAELTRYKRNSSDPWRYYQTKSAFFIRLLQRGYTYKYLAKHCNLDWSAPPSVPTQAVVPFVIPYSTRQNLLKLPSILHPFKNAFTQWLPGKTIITVFSKSQNVQSLITSSTISNSQIMFLAGFDPVLVSPTQQDLEDKTEFSSSTSAYRSTTRSGKRRKIQ